MIVVQNEEDLAKLAKLIVERDSLIELRSHANQELSLSYYYTKVVSSKEPEFKEILFDFLDKIVDMKLKSIRQKIEDLTKIPSPKNNLVQFKVVGKE